MSFREKAKIKFSFAKLFRSSGKGKSELLCKDEGLPKVAERSRGEAKTKDNGTSKVRVNYSQQRTDHELRRFQSSKDYNRRRNGICEKDYFDFLRLKTKRVQQQIIDTYVYGWR